jgi:hypothetical protein
VFIWLVMFVPVGCFYNYIIGDGVDKYYESTKESNNGIISLKSVFYI